MRTNLSSYYCGEGGVFGIKPTERAMLLGFGAYGYSLFGRYQKSKSLFIEAMECLDEESLKKPFNSMIHIMLNIGYVNCYVIPTKENEDLRTEFLAHMDEAKRQLSAFGAGNWERMKSPLYEYSVHIVENILPYDVGEE